MICNQCEMRIRNPNLLALFTLIIISATSGKLLADPERELDPITLTINPEQSLKRVLVDGMKVRNCSLPVGMFLRNIDEYLLWPQGVPSCPRPLITTRLTETVAGLLPSRPAIFHNMYELQYPGYDIKFTTAQVAESPLLTWLKEQLIPIYDVNALVHFLQFLANQVPEYPFWDSLSDDAKLILENNKLAEVVANRRANVLEAIRVRKKQFIIDTNSPLVRYLMYKGVRLDDVQQLFAIIRQCRKRGLKIDEYFQPANLDRLLAEENLESVARLHGLRRAFDSIFTKYHINPEEIGRVEKFTETSSSHIIT